MTELSDRDREILDFEKRRWRYASQKDQAIRDTFDLSPIRYAQQLNVLIDREEALARNPVMVKRLRRQRVAREMARTARRLAG